MWENISEIDEGMFFCPTHPPSHSGLFLFMYLKHTNTMTGGSFCFQQSFSFSGITPSPLFTGAILIGLDVWTVSSSGVHISTVMAPPHLRGKSEQHARGRGTQTKHQHLGLLSLWCRITEELRVNTRRSEKHWLHLSLGVISGENRLPHWAALSLHTHTLHENGHFMLASWTALHLSLLRFLLLHLRSVPC